VPPQILERQIAGQRTHDDSSCVRHDYLTAVTGVGNAGRPVHI
jgi:hypothetical protein